VYVTSFDGNLYAFNPDGTLKWRTDVGEWVYSSPAIGSDGNVYVGSDEGFLYALYPDGSIIWRFEVSGPVASSPAIDSDGIVYFGAGNRFYAVNPLGQGRIEWFIDTYGQVMSSPVIGPDGAIYVGSDDGALYAVRGSGKLDNGSWPRFRHDARNTGRVTAW
jgi:outer membrane protein assembly factor BamB